MRPKYVALDYSMRCLTVRWSFDYAGVQFAAAEIARLRSRFQFRWAFRLMDKNHRAGGADRGGRLCGGHCVARAADFTAL